MQVISGAGHHVYADKAEIFNQYVNEACNYCDQNSNSAMSQNEATESEPEDNGNQDTHDGNNNNYHNTKWDNNADTMRGLK